MSIARHHAEWLALIDVSGPFLSLKTLVGAFPQGLDAPDAEVTRDLRLAYEEWLDSAFGTRPDPAMHWAWVEWVIRRVLEMPSQTLRASGIGYRVSDDRGVKSSLEKRLTVSVPEHGETLCPDFVIGEPISADPMPDTRHPILDTRASS
jgi:hypothetical protein